MIINKIKLKGFRNIDTSIFELKDLIALISTNNYGKSNVLEGIRFGINFIKYNDLGKDYMMKWTRGIPLNRKQELENYKIEFEMETNIDKKEYIIQYGYEFKWFRNDGTGQKIVGEYLKFKEKEDKRFSIYIDRNENEAFYKSSNTGRCNTKIKINSNELVINKLKMFDELFYKGIINEINSIKFYIERHLDASSSYKWNYIVLDENQELDLSNIEDLPKIIYMLKENYNDKYQLLESTFRQLFPEIRKIEIEKLEFKYDKKEFSEDIPFKISNELYKIMVFDKNLNQPINFESMSDGSKRIFLQLATIIIAQIQGYSFVAIEEPENSIHPMLFQSYLRVISQFRGDCKIIITSHSPFLLRYLKNDNIYVGIPNDDGIAKFAHIKKTCNKQLEKISNKFDISPADYIMELLNGTKEDKDDLIKILEV